MIATVVGVSAMIMILAGKRKIDRRVETMPRLSIVVADSTSIARGQHLTDIHLCRTCHADDLAGRVFLDVPPFRAVAGNLTPGPDGAGASYDVSDWDRAIRLGVKPDGRRLLAMMPSRYLHALCDADVHDMIAYLQSLAPVDHSLPKSTVRIPGYILSAFAGVELTVSTESSFPPAPDLTPEPTKRYGRYLAHISCVACHGDNLRGGDTPDPESPRGADLGVVAAYTLDEFARTMRTGLTPAGRQLDKQWMPWDHFEKMTDDEVESLYRYLKDIVSMNR